MGLQVAIIVVLGIIYPTALCSADLGWGQAAGRVGALIAPAVGAIILGAG